MSDLIVVTRDEWQEFKALKGERDRLALQRIHEALRDFDSCDAPRTHIDALDLVAEVRYRLGGHHVAYPENIGDPRYDRSAWEDSPWAR